MLVHYSVNNSIKPGFRNICVLLFYRKVSLLFALPLSQHSDFIRIIVARGRAPNAPCDVCKCRVAVLSVVQEVVRVDLKVCIKRLHSYINASVL